MVLTLKEAQNIASELRASHIMAMVGEGLDKLYFYVYSTDPMMKKCGCNRRTFDNRAKKVVEKRVSQFENVIVTMTGVPRAL